MTYPYAVQDVPVGEDPDVEVGLDDVMELALLLVPEEGVRHPHLLKKKQQINQQPSLDFFYLSS